MKPHVVEKRTVVPWGHHQRRASQGRRVKRTPTWRPDVEHHERFVDVRVAVAAAGGPIWVAGVVSDDIEHVLPLRDGVVPFVRAYGAVAVANAYARDSWELTMFPVRNHDEHAVLEVALRDPLPARMPERGIYHGHRAGGNVGFRRRRATRGCGSHVPVARGVRAQSTSPEIDVVRRRVVESRELAAAQFGGGCGEAVAGCGHLKCATRSTESSRGAERRAQGRPGCQTCASSHVTLHVTEVQAPPPSEAQRHLDKAAGALSSASYMSTRDHPGSGGAPLHGGEQERRRELLSKSKDEVVEIVLTLERGAAAAAGETGLASRLGRSHAAARMGEAAAPSGEPPAKVARAADGSGSHKPVTVLRSIHSDYTCQYQLEDPTLIAPGCAMQAVLLKGDVPPVETPPSSAEALTDLICASGQRGREELTRFCIEDKNFNPCDQVIRANHHKPPPLMAAIVTQNFENIVTKVCGSPLPNGFFPALPPPSPSSSSPAPSLLSPSMPPLCQFEIIKTLLAAGAPIDEWCALYGTNTTAETLYQEHNVGEALQSYVGKIFTLQELRNSV